MDNQYLRQFPDIMAGKKIMYVHGFGSSAQSGTVALLRQLLPSATFVARDIPLHPDEAVDMLKAMCEEEQPDLIIGTSMGGMYTEQLKGYDRILVNPAFCMGETMQKHGLTGKQVFSNPRTDGVSEFIVTKSLIKEYTAITTRCFEDITPDDARRVVGMFGDEDPMVDTFDLFREHYPTAIRFHGAHRLNDKVALHYLVPIIRRIDDRQEGRRRPVVFIGTETLFDSYGNATASMHKAYERLIEHYEVYIVASAPDYDLHSTEETEARVERFLNAPAHGRVVYANNRALLCGDYLIASTDCPDFVGTTVEWGSSDFKTWEEIIVFFDRLGGQ